MFTSFLRFILPLRHEEARLPNSIHVRRIGAFVIDLALVSGTAIAIHSLTAFLTTDIRSLLLSALPGILVLGLLVGADGRTPGKRALGLRVVEGTKTRISLGKGLVRELIRFLSLPILVLPILYLVLLLRGEQPPYDRFLGLNVVEDQ
jgi:uncharacterized RDD family membrane protein YckC